MREAMVARRPDGAPRDAFILVRGEYDKKGDQVSAGVPAVFPPLPAGAPTNRLGTYVLVTAAMRWNYFPRVGNIYAPLDSRK